MTRSLLVDDIGELVTCEPSLGRGDGLGVLADAAMVVEEGRVAWVGPRGQAPAADARVSAEGACVIPGFVDSHAHLVFGGERSAEFEARMAGRPYEAGGIATTVAATRQASDAELLSGGRARLREMHAGGTTTVEAKSGYGLDLETERRLLEISRELTAETTFLGAHVVPQEYAEDREAYVALVTGPMLDACAPLARWIDVFCDRGAFDEDETREVLTAGVAAGLGVRLHGNQLGPGPGAKLAAEFGAASCDHCNHLHQDDVAALRDAGVVATLLPAADFSTRSSYPDARTLLDAGLTVALATDCNPGTAYVTSMAFVMALAVREMRMSPAEALWSATAGGAAALRRDDIGRLAPGCSADFAILKAPSYVHLTYRPGSALVSQTWIAGERVWNDARTRD